MTDPENKLRRQDLRRLFRRDLERIRRRGSARGSFWRALAVLGSVGWPIAIMAVGGAILGRWLNRQWGLGDRLTLLLILVGAALGSVAAWSMIRGTKA